MKIIVEVYLKFSCEISEFCFENYKTLKNRLKILFERFE